MVTWRQEGNILGCWKSLYLDVSVSASVHAYVKINQTLCLWYVHFIECKFKVHWKKRNNQQWNHTCWRGLVRWSVQLASCLFWCSSPHSPPCDHQSPTDLTIPSLCPLQPMLSEAAAGWPVASCQHVPILTALTEVSLPLGGRSRALGTVAAAWGVVVICISLSTTTLLSSLQ